MLTESSDGNNDTTYSNSIEFSGPSWCQCSSSFLHKNEDYHISKYKVLIVIFLFRVKTLVFFFFSLSLSLSKNYGVIFDDCCHCTYCFWHTTNFRYFLFVKIFMIKSKLNLKSPLVPLIISKTSFFLAQGRDPFDSNNVYLDLTALNAWEVGRSSCKVFFCNLDS